MLTEYYPKKLETLPNVFQQRNIEDWLEQLDAGEFTYMLPHLFF